MSDKSQLYSAASTHPNQTSSCRKPTHMPSDQNSLLLLGLRNSNTGQTGESSPHMFPPHQSPFLSCQFSKGLSDPSEPQCHHPKIPPYLIWGRFGVGRISDGWELRGTWGCGTWGLSQDWMQTCGPGSSSQSWTGRRVASAQGSMMSSARLSRRCFGLGLWHGVVGLQETTSSWLGNSICQLLYGIHALPDAENHIKGGSLAQKWENDMISIKGSKSWLVPIPTGADTNTIFC